MSHLDASEPDTDAGWTMIHEPRRPWLDLRLGELWYARDLILLFVRRDLHRQRGALMACDGRGMIVT